LFNISIIFMFGWEARNLCFCRGGSLRLSVRGRERRVERGWTTKRAKLGYELNSNWKKAKLKLWDT